MDDRYWDARSETLPDTDRRAVRDHRLHWQLRRSWDGSPFYKARFEAAGLDLASFNGLEDLAKLPPLHADDLTAECEAAPPFGRLTVAPAHWWMDADPDQAPPRRVRTDGDVSHAAGLAARAIWAAGGRSGQGLVLSGRETDRQATQAIEAGAARIGMTVVESVPGPDGGSALHIRVTADATRHVDDRRDDPRNLSWRLGDAYASSAARGPQVAFGLPLVGPVLAYTCVAEQGLHWADDHLLLEVVDSADPAGRRARPLAEAGALVLTELTREGSPLVRFWTGYTTVLDDRPCPCGRTSVRSRYIRPIA